MTANSWSLSGKLGCLCVVLASVGSGGAVQAKGTFTVLPAYAFANSINDSGFVTGYVGEGTLLGFLRAPDGSTTTFSAADASQTEPQCINNAGAITGYYFTSGYVAHGFVRAADGTITTFDAPGAGQMEEQGTVALSINAHGVIAGVYTDQSGKEHGFVRAADGSIASIDVAGANYTWASGINDKGEIVGNWFDTKEHGFVRSAAGEITSFDVSEGDFGTEGDAIDNKGDVTGFYLDEMNRERGYFRKPDGTSTTFDAGLGTVTNPIAMNAKGAITGIDNTKKEKYGEQSFVRYPSGKLKAIAAHSNGETFALDINKDGTVVGSFTTYTDHHQHGTTNGFIWTP